jgi:hypothetical protein
MLNRMRALMLAPLAILLVLGLAGCDFLQELGFLPPDAPTGLAVGDATTSSLSLSWNSATGATSYQVYRSTSQTGPWTTVAYDGSATACVNTGLTAGTTYYYEVRATNDAGSSENSSAVTGTTTAIVLSSDALLSSIAITDGTNTYSYTPSFSSTTYSYDAGTVETPDGPAPVYLVLTLRDTTATITSVTETTPYMGTTIDTGTDGTYTLALLDYNNTVTIVTTAQDGTSTATYTITIQNYYNG